MVSRHPWTESFWRVVSKHPQHWNSLHAGMGLEWTSFWSLCSTLLMNIPDIVSRLTRCLRLPRKHLVTTGIQILTKIQENLWYTINWMHFICQYRYGIKARNNCEFNIIEAQIASRPESRIYFSPVGSHDGGVLFHPLVHKFLVLTSHSYSLWNL